MSFYKMDPGAWDFGTAELSLEEEAAYLRIVNAIHKIEEKAEVGNSNGPTEAAESGQ